MILPFSNKAELVRSILRVEGGSCEFASVDSMSICSNARRELHP